MRWGRGQDRGEAIGMSGDGYQGEVKRKKATRNEVEQRESEREGRALRWTEKRRGCSRGEREERGMGAESRRECR